MQTNTQVSNTHTWEQRGLNTTNAFNDSWVEGWYKNKSALNKTNCIVGRKKMRYEINDIQSKLKDCMHLLNYISACESNLRVNVSTMFDSDWRKEIARVNDMKVRLDSLLDSFDDQTISRLKNQIKKRISKRAQLKRKKLERKKEYQELIETRMERNRSIDAILEKKKKEKEELIQKEETERDKECILRNVLKNKSEARQSLALLNALTKLRKARKLTLLGRGEKLTDGDEPFQICIEKLHLMWTERLKLYEDEEKELHHSISEKEKIEKLPEDKKSEECIKQWKEFLFGQGNEYFHRDFAGNVQQFLNVRSEWDKYVDQTDGSTLPIGWILPQL